MLAHELTWHAGPLTSDLNMGISLATSSTCIQIVMQRQKDWMAGMQITSVNNNI